MISSKFFPKDISEFDFYNDDDCIYTKLFTSLDDIVNLQNMIIAGLPGTGKKTRVYSLLSHILGNSIYKIKNNIIEVNNIKISFKYSIFHTEINLKDYTHSELDIIYKYLSDYSQSLNIGFNIPKIIILHNFNNTDKIFQKKLKILLDNNITTSRFILICNTYNNIISDITSRCLIIRIPCPNKNNIKNILIKTANKYNINYSDNDLDIIIDSCIQEDMFPNIKNIINKFELSYIKGTFNLYKLNYINTLDNIYNSLIKKNVCLKDIINIRNLTHKLFVNTVSSNYIIKYITNKLIKNNKIHIDVKYNILNHSTNINIKLFNCHKELIILEYFFIGIIKILNINT